MSIESSRLIYVDDTSPLIFYEGQWALESISTTKWGRPFRDTLQRSDGGTFSFNFAGSSVYVIGSFLTSTPPSWTCFVDGFALISNNISETNLNNVEICSLQNIKTIPSTLTVVASGTTPDDPLVFDRIQYTPDPSVILDNLTTVVVDAFDDQIHYDSGWSKLGTIGMETSVQGASMTFDFVVAFNSNAAINSSAQYSIDNETLFPIQVAAHNSTIQTHELVSFRTPYLRTRGPHRLFVQFGGANNSANAAPLVLDHLVIDNFTTGSPFIPSPHNARLSKGAIAGIVIGSLVGLAIVMTSLIRVVRNRKWAAVSLRPYMAQDYSIH